MEYKIVVYGEGIYREVSLKNEYGSGLVIGTEKEANLKFIKEKFDIEFKISFKRAEEKWNVLCGDTVYLTVEKESLKREWSLIPGEVLQIFSTKTEQRLFCIELVCDFGGDYNDYSKRMDCRNCSQVSIGGLTDSMVRILLPQIEQDEICLEKDTDGYLVHIEKCRYGVYRNGCRINEKSSRIHNCDFVSFSGCQFYIEDGWIYFAEKLPFDTKLYVESVWPVKNHMKYPVFLRSVRQLYGEPTEKLEILPPKQLPEEPQTNLIMTIVPILASAMLTVVMRGVMGKSGVYMIYCVGAMILSGVMAVWNYRNQGKRYKERVAKRQDQYEDYLLVQEEKIQAVREKEKYLARQRNSVLEEQLTFIEDFDARLFEKQRNDKDFLSCYIGKGTMESVCQIQYREPEYKDTEDPLTEYPRLLHDKYQYIEEMPIMLELKNKNAVGFVGERGKLYQIAKNLILTLSATHYYNDIKFFFVLKEEDKAFFAWARWLRHTKNETIGVRNFMYDEESRKVLLEYLYAEFSERESMDEKAMETKPHYVVFVYRSEYINGHPISNYVEKAKDLGIVFLFFEEYAELVNKDCDSRVFLKSGVNEGYVQQTEDGENIQKFYYPHISAKQAAEAALRLGCVYVEEVSLESALTKNITLFQLLNIESASELQLEQRWRNSRIYDSMATPLGVKSGDEVVYLDLHEKAHGPHGLVAGTTGSGKSEILQTYILSMATLFHPYEVGFIIIDFKGGGMVNQFKNLPHLNGAITNIDGKEINRSLLSIRAELRKRQELFAENEVNHIDDYIRLFKAGKAQRPLPHLILIVDEFAELKSEQPEFMKELISTARIGRSLGVHLILATQKPAGVVNDQIWSNSKFKLCLKVQNKEDSNEVLKSPLAAEIREPGRAYLQVGNNEIFQLFQSAYSGATVPNSSMGEVKPFVVNRIDLAGRRTVIYEQKPAQDTGNMSQLDALVEYIRQYCAGRKIKRLPNICMPALEYQIPYTNEKVAVETGDICVPIGYYDDPSRQLQAITEVNFSQNHIYIVGSSRYGKSNLLQVMVRGLVDRYSSDEVNIYILDFATLVMKNFEALNCVGGIVTARDDEKLKNLIKMLLEEVEKRKNLLAGMGLSSFSAYRESGYRELSQIIVMIDNFGAVKEMYPKYEEDLLSICREGIAVGISMVATTSQSTAVGYKYVPNFGKRIALFCNESAEYTHAFEHCRIKPDNKPGRCILEIDKELYEGQIYLAFSAEKEIEKITQIREFIEESNQKDRGLGAVRIPEIPAVVTAEFITRQTGGKFEAYKMVSGINYATTKFDYLHLLQTGIIGIGGREHGGTSNFLKYIIADLLKHKEEAPVKIHIVDNLKRKLETFGQDKEDVVYSCNPAEVESYVNNLTGILKERYQWMLSGNEKNLEKAPLLVLVMNAGDCYSVLGSNANLVEAYVNIINRYRMLKVCIIMAQMPNASLNFGASPIWKSVKEVLNMYLFYNLSEQKMVDISLAVQREFAKPLEVGEAFNICAGNLEKLKTPLYTPET